MNSVLIFDFRKWLTPISSKAHQAKDDRLHPHVRCGSLVNLSVNNRTAERRRPLDEFNSGVVMTYRPLRNVGFVFVFGTASNIVFSCQSRNLFEFSFQLL